MISILISELFLHNFQFLKTQTKIPSESLAIDFKKEETKLAIIYYISKNYFSFKIMPKNLVILKRLIASQSVKFLDIMQHSLNE